MDILQLHKNSVDKYTQYIRSFIDIRDEDILREVERQLASGRLWPDPLIQFNPSYRSGKSISELIDEGVLAKEIENVFSGYNLYWHQEMALRLGAEKRSFIVTSGTGSGKSLTYIGTVFSNLLNSGFGKGVKALIVYPMNALINSQIEELRKYQAIYKEVSGNGFPISFNAYTGQTGEEARKDIVSSPPDILLTNYMMLELLLTRSAEAGLRDSIFNSLEYLTFDELHTYRGRQGADVSYLIRRIRALCQKGITCMGTSATMSSRGSQEDRKAAVAEVATKVFGEKIDPDQVIGEQLDRSLNWEGKMPDSKELLTPIDSSQRLESLKRHPLAIWLENTAALKEAELQLERCSPNTISGLGELLSKKSGLGKTEAESRILSLLNWIANVNKEQSEQGERYTCLPFKLHQFFAQTGSVYATLGIPGSRKITLEAGLYEGEESEFVYPHVFSRSSGHSFICVFVENGLGQLFPREFNMMESGDYDDFGYIIPEYDSNPEETFWNGDESDLEMLPPSWTTRTKRDGFKIQKKYEDRAPRRIYYDSEGRFSFSESSDLPHSGWYMSAEKGLLFDPTAGLFFESNTNERTKLTSLGNEGRSTSTTITSFIILNQLAKAGLAPQDQKLLSFTDNRQDAALQAGHFNDFIRIVRIRSAIYHSLKDSEKGELRSSQIGTLVREKLALNVGIYSKNPTPFPSERRSIDNCLEKFLTYQVIHDLRRGWRVVLPNLEKCALLEIEYEDRIENSEYEEGWKDVPLFNELAPEARAELLRDVLDYFRLEYAIESKSWLEPSIINENQQVMRSKLRDEWTLKSENEVEPGALRRGPLHRRNRFRTSSLGLTSALGKYLKQFVRSNKLDVQMTRDGYELLMDELIKALVACGYLVHREVRDPDNNPTQVYQLTLEKILWKLGDGEKVRRDVVKQRSYQGFLEKPNAFFQSLYQTDFQGVKNLRGEDHTGQLDNETRVDREQRFRAEWKTEDGRPDLSKVNSDSLSALFCSPTMELGIDISTLSVVHMRNAPPNPANYAQRSGRAGRSGQAALVFAYCSAYSPHDRHYFNDRTELVAGSVEPPRLDIANRELIRSHLNAVFMTQCGLRDISQSVLDLIDIEQPDLPLKNEVLSSLKLSDETIGALIDHFKKVLVDKPNNIALSWCDDAWIERQLRNLPAALDKTLERWRNLYQQAMTTNKKATAVLETGLYTTSSDEYKKAKREISQSHRQLEILRNDSRKPNAQSEFYVFRYLAAEGFLPGYNFTRLPIRAFLTDGHERGEYISRPRLIALREFGPRNIIYHIGQKYRISQVVLPNVEDSLLKARACTASGYWLDQGQETTEICPITGTDLSSNKNRKELNPLLPLTEMLATRREYITCEEEERSRQGFEMETYFSLDGGDVSSVRKALIQLKGETLLKMSYLPAARLIQLSKKDRRERQDGFRIGLDSGLWNPRDDIEDAEPSMRVQLFTETTADSLYIQPVEALALENDGIYSLQYALKRAIELRFQIEPAELGVVAMGDKETPNILFYEASEGSLGVLSAMVDNPKIFNEVIEAAIKVCDFENVRKPKATYDDLLSYYNQRFHLTMDRFSIKDALSRLSKCTLDCSNVRQDKDYQAQYERLLREMDSNSSTEEQFLRFLHSKNLRLPDSAQKSVDGIYTMPDFFYEPDVWVFCDGTPHDDPEVQADDLAKRKAIRDRGDEVIVYYYKDNLESLVSKYPDIFREVRS